MLKKLLLVLLIVSLLIVTGCFNKEKKEELPVETIVQKIKVFARGDVTAVTQTPANNLMTGFYLTLDDKSHYYYSFADFVKSSPVQEERFSELWANCIPESSYLVDSTGKTPSVQEIRAKENNFRTALNETARTISSVDFSNKITTSSILVRGIDNLKIYADGYGIKVLFSPEKESYTTAQVITLSPSITSSGVVIRYTTKSFESISANSNIYTTSTIITVSSSALTIKAKAYHKDWVDGQVWTKSASVKKAEKPEITPAGGSFTNAVNVSITVANSENLFVRYTLDGKDPAATNGILYDGEAIKIVKPGVTTIKAIAYQEGYGDSEIAVQEITITDKDAPTFGTQIVFSEVGKNSMKLSWGQGSDNLTAQGALKYKLVKGISSADIDTLEEADLVSTANIVMDWTTGSLSCIAAGLESGKKYSFAVIIRDESGNKTLSQVKSQATLDVEPPKPQNSTNQIWGGSATETKVQLEWTTGSDNLTTGEAIQYKLVRASTPTAIDTIAKADSVTGAELVMDWTANKTSMLVTGLSPSNDYYFTVLVKDESGNKIRYQTIKKTTEDKAILSEVKIASNNADTTMAKTGDKITILFTASKDIKTPVAAICGNSAVVTIINSSDPKKWQAEYTLTGSETEGTVTFNIAFESLEGVAGTSVTATTDSSSVTIDNTAPTFTNVYFTVE